MIEPRTIERRQAIKWMTLAAGVALYGRSNAYRLAAEPAPVTGSGYGSDPKVNGSYHPGDFWPLTLTADQRELTGALCDVILPGDETSPPASHLGIPAFIDEWISAPYDMQRADRPIILDGLVWLEKESDRRFQTGFRNLSDAQRTATCDPICFVPKATPEFADGAKFFAKFRDLTIGAYATCPEGLKAMGYTGNVPMPSFDGPPEELIRKLGLG